MSETVVETEHTPTLCAGCGGVVPKFVTKRFFFDSPGDVTHNSDACVKMCNDKLDARRAQKAAGPELYEALSMVDAACREAHQIAISRGEQHAAGHFDQIRSIATAALSKAKGGTNEAL